MVEKLMQELAKKYKLRDTKGIFVSGFDAIGKLLFSEGVVETDKTIEDLMTELYATYIAPIKDIKVITIDVVTTVFEETNIGKIPTTSPKNYGFAIVDDKDTTGVILPGTKGVADAKHALYLIKQKYAIQGKVKIFVFTTDRLLVNLS